MYGINSEQSAWNHTQSDLLYLHSSHLISNQFEMNTDCRLSHWKPSFRSELCAQMTSLFFFMWAFICLDACFKSQAKAVCQIFTLYKLGALKSALTGEDPAQVESTYHVQVPNAICQSKKAFGVEMSRLFACQLWEIFGPLMGLMVNAIHACHKHSF